MGEEQPDRARGVREEQLCSHLGTQVQAGEAVTDKAKALFEKMKSQLAIVTAEKMPSSSVE